MNNIMDNSNKQQLRAGVPYILEALRAIPLCEKLEYQEAVRTSPHLIETESDPLSFLRYCNWDAAAAARRLVVYWRWRKQLFGSRAFLPLLDLSGNGALGRDEMELLRSGLLCLLPDDIHGRPVLCLDKSRTPLKFCGALQTDTRLRVFFFMCQQLALLSISAQTVGCICVAWGPPPSTNIDPCIQKATEMLTKVFPVRVQKVHIAYYLEERYSFLQSLVPFLMEQIGRFLSSRVVVHNCSSLEQLVASMARHGISRNSLPRSMGGFRVIGGPTGFSSYTVAGGDTTVVDGDFQRGGRPSAECQMVDVSGAGVDLQRECMWNPATIQSPPEEHEYQQQTLTQPQQDVVAHDDVLRDLSSALFTEEMLEEVIGSDLDDSPFDPIPIGTSTAPQQHLDASYTSMLVDEDMHLLDDSDNPLDETPEMLKRSLTALEEIMSGLPVAEKGAYEQATQRAPDVVKTESNPLSYLRFEKFNGWAAAKRLALYWKHRVQHFDDRAYLPLTQTMSGALWEEDLKTLSSGYLFLLPQDAKGRPVLCCDPSKRPDGVSKASQIRVAMYFFSILSREYPAVETEGCVFFIFVSSQSMLLSKFDDTIREVTDIALDSFPIQNRETHVICSPSPSAAISPLRSFTAVVMPALLRASQQLLTPDRTHFHVGERRQELEFKLVACGLSGASVQAAVNGGISDADFAEWIKNRRLLESQRSAHGRRQDSPTLSPAAVNQETTSWKTDPHDEGPSESTGTSSANQEGPSGVPTETYQDTIATNTDQQQNMLESSAATFDVHHSHDQALLSPPATAGLPLPHDGLAEITKIPMSLAIEPHDTINSSMRLLPASEVSAYWTAMEKAPALVQKESDPSRFLRMEKYDSMAASKRLAAYWRIRLELFGDERAFLPMDQTGEGTLNRKDVSALQQTGFLTQLPNDASGCGVLCCDEEQLGEASRKARRRIFFYLGTVLSQNDHSQTMGIRVLYALTADGSVNETCIDGLNLALEAHPIKMKCFHLLACCPGGTSKDGFCQSAAFGDVMERLNHSVQEKVVVHVAASRATFASELEGYELSKDLLPKGFGGIWGLEDFVLWQELRLRYEWELPTRDPAHALHTPLYSIPFSCGTAALPPSQLTEDEKVVRNRRLNSLHSKRRRDRVRVDFHDLHEKRRTLEVEKHALLKEGRDLQLLLDIAKAMVNEVLTRDN